MDSLYKLQLVCFVFMIINAAALGLTRLHVKWVNRRYEFSRWTLFVSMLLMALQYFIQMEYGIRAASDEVATVVNILFYMPCFAMFAVAIYNIVAVKVQMLRYVSGNVILYALAVAVCVVSYVINGNLEVGKWVYVMLALFVMSMTHSIAILVREIGNRKKVLELETTVDMVIYSRYSRSSLVVLFTSAYMVACSISSSKILLVLGPLVLFAVFFFVITFISLGFNNAPTEQLICLDEAAAVEEAGAKGGEETEAKDVDDALREPSLSEERMEEIGRRLEEWCANSGFKDCGVNMLTLSRGVKVPKNQLSIYFEKGMHCTFRVWLSDIRFKAAQTMMLEHPDYSNDVISSECGFSSRSYLYRIFKERLGETPTEWRAEQTELALRESVPEDEAR